MSTPGQDAFEGYSGQAQGRSLIDGKQLPVWEMLPRDIQDAWEAAAAAVRGPVEAHTTIAGVKAVRCQFGAQEAHHPALRYVWHHILPQVCGGKSTKDNLAELCDNCHYAVHSVLYALSRGAAPAKAATADQFDLAEQGYRLAVAAGTQGKIPKESSS